MHELSICDQLVEQVSRRAFQSLLEKFDADKWVKSFACRQHLVAMMFAQLSTQTSLHAVGGGIPISATTSLGCFVA